MAKIDALFRKGKPEQIPDQPVYMTDSTGRRMKIIREQDLGGGTYWFVAEEEPSYGVSEIKEVNHG